LTYVSILIAARNEEETIIDCLEAIARLAYPSRQMEVLIGNDQSSDRTAQLVLDYIKGKEVFRFFDIHPHEGGQLGKTNVLLQLLRHARGEYFFFTDADVRVPAHWISDMLLASSPTIGLITGTTLPDGPRWFDRIQALEWLYSLILIHFAAKWRIPVTAMGNNMMVSRAAYLATGGYENLPFSIVEDQQLFREVIRKGYGFRQLLQTGVLAYTRPCGRLADWLQQRKRWMRGAMQISWPLILLLFGQAFFVPSLIVLAFFFPKLALATFALKWTMDGSIIYGGLNRLARLDLLKYLPAFWLFQAFLPVLLIVFYFLPFPIKWKEREYT